jgi:putative acetyltransferase
MSAKTNATALLRPMLPIDGPVLAAIFQASIEELTDEDYDDAQRNAWAAADDDESSFAARLFADLTIVATVDGAPVGFVALKGADHIDMLYVYPPVARQGVATMLCDAVEKLAAARGAKALTVDASDTAKPLFDARGFEAERRQTVAIGDCWLGNTRMRKSLNAA